MAYHGYIPIIKRKLSETPTPRVLEVGLDTGITTIPIIAFLARVHEKFEFVGIDILVKESLSITLSHLDTSSDQNIRLYRGNSLNVMPEMAAAGEKFDVILVDGDHNYHTVSQELKTLEQLLAPNGLVIVDDYHGKWSERDLYYNECPGYENVEGATQRVETEKQGVKPAVDEWLEANPNWESKVYMQGEPIVLQRRELSMFGKSVFSL